MNTERKTGTLRMRGDPFLRKKTVRYIAIIDQGIAGLLLFYAAYRLVNYDFRDQSLIVFIGATDSVLIAIIYWLGVFALIGLQLVIAFLLLTATKDMTTDPETMMKKCHFWRTFSLILLILLSIDLLISVYIFFIIDGGATRLVSTSLDGGEILFRAIGIFIIGKFINDLHSLFGAPMVTSSAASTPPVPRTSRTSSMIGTSSPLPRVCRTPSLFFPHGESPLQRDGLSPLFLSVDQDDENDSSGVSLVRTPSSTRGEIPGFPRRYSRTPSVIEGGGSTGRGRRENDTVYTINIDDSPL